VCLVRSLTRLEFHPKFKALPHLRTARRAGRVRRMLHPGIERRSIALPQIIVTVRLYLTNIADSHVTGPCYDTTTLA
jgi:hypothetical protein